MHNLLKKKRIILLVIMMLILYALPFGLMFVYNYTPDKYGKYDYNYSYGPTGF